jgi:hypothetical protein
MELFGWKEWKVYAEGTPEPNCAQLNHSWIPQTFLESSEVTAQQQVGGEIFNGTVKIAEH